MRAARNDRSTPPAGRPALSQAIADVLSSEIARGHYAPGDRLPTEAALASRFGVNRHTVRSALAALAQAGTIRSRRGAGSFVAARPTDYPLGRRVRFQQNLAASGRAASRRFTRIETRPCDAAEADALGLAPGSVVHVIEGLSLADGAPMARFRSVFPAGRLPAFAADVARLGSVTQALAAGGVADYTRAHTRITAESASPVDALALHLRPGDPLLRSVSLNRDPEGRAIEYGSTWFAGDRVALTLASDGDLTAP
jgi:GntR family phosphonate transport system transcriptional regulator